MKANDDLIEQTLFALEELLQLINDGGNHTVAMEALVRLCGYRCESFLVGSGRVGVIKENPLDWLKSH